MSCDRVVYAAANKIEWKDIYNEIPDEEKLLIILKCMKCCSAELPRMKIDKKNAYDCSIWYNAANNIYTHCSDERNLTEACQMYNRCIAFAPPNSPELAHAYANKSAVLFRLKKYEGCLEAVNTRLQFKCTKDWKMTMFLRKAQCLTKLKREEAATFIKETKEWLKQKMPKNKKALKKLEDCLTDKKGSDGEKIVVNFDSLPSNLKPTRWNSEVPSVSSSVTMKIKDENRCFEATRNIRPGEIIAKERSYWKVLYPESKYDNCWGCLKELENCIPCDHCVQVMFCSEKCKKESWEKFHDVECQILPFWLQMTHSRRLEMMFIASLRMAILAIKEFGSIEALRQNLHQIEKQDPKRKGFSDDDKFHSDSYRSIHGSKIEMDVCEDSYLTLCLVWSCMLVNTMANETTFFGKKMKAGWPALAKNEDVVLIASLLFRNAVFACCQNFSIELPSQESSEDAGIDISPIISMMSRVDLSSFSEEEHPNSQVIYKGDYHLVIAINRIEKGDEIKIIEPECNPFSDFSDFISLQKVPWWQRRERSARSRMNDVEQQLSLIDLVEYKLESGNMENPKKVVKMMCETQSAIEILQECGVSKNRMVEVGDVMTQIYKKYVF